jgi:hypothetical protein
MIHESAALLGSESQAIKKRSAASDSASLFVAGCETIKTTEFMGL